MRTTSEAAAELGVTPVRVRQLARTGVIQAEKLGRDFLIPQSEIEKAKKRKTKPGPAPAKKGAK
jgi:excisionase family DNA binding protein